MGLAHRCLLVAATVGMIAGVAPADAQLVFDPPFTVRTTTGAILFNHTMNRLAEIAATLPTLYASRAALSADIASARADFWRNLSAPEGYDARYERYMTLLLAKDMIYASAFVVEGFNSDHARAVSRLGGEIDGGWVNEYAYLFRNWVETLRRLMGGGGVDLAIVTPDKLAAALAHPEAVAAYDRYRMQRDRREFHDAGHGAYFDRLMEQHFESLPVPPKARLRAAPNGDKLHFTVVHHGPYHSPKIDDAFFAKGFSTLTYDFADEIAPNALQRVAVAPTLPIRPEHYTIAHFYTESAFGRMSNLPKRLTCQYRHLDKEVVISSWYKTLPTLPDLPTDLAYLADLKDVSDHCPDRLPPSAIPASAAAGAPAAP